MKRQSSGLPVIESTALKGATGVRHAFFTREGGVSAGIYRSLNCGFGSDDNPAKVAENRRRASVSLDVAAESLVTSYQVHGTDVAIVEEPWARAAAPQADGMATRVPGIALGILTADCAPVLFADTEAGVVGACHAGWRGALEGIIEATLSAMDGLGARRTRIRAAIGPCIAQISYQVGVEFRDRFLAAESTNAAYFENDDEGRYRFDLPGYVSERLKRAGIAGVDWVGHDTCADDARLFSYRRSTQTGEADFGRGLSAIALAAR